MPSFCGLPCFKSKDQRHTDEQVVEKPVVVAVPVQSSSTAAAPAQTSTLKPSLTQPETTHIKSTSTGYHTAGETEQPSKTEPPTTTTANETQQQLPEVKPIEPTEPTTTQQTEPTTTQPNNEEMDSLKGAADGVSNTVSSGAQQASSGVQSAASTAQNTASAGAEQVTSAAGGSGSEGTDKWNAMSEEQKKATYDALPAEKKQNLSYYEWIAQGYHHQKENWMPWIEDVYLKWFTSDNKASYATKDTLDKSKVTGVEQIDTLQDGANNLVAGQVGQGGLLQPVGDMVSKEGVNRAERGGKDDSGSYAGAIGSSASSAGSSLWSGAKSAGGYVSGMLGGKKEGAEESK